MLTSVERVALAKRRAELKVAQWKMRKFPLEAMRVMIRNEHH